jgi:hypothetical protein
MGDLIKTPGPPAIIRQILNDDLKKLLYLPQLTIAFEENFNHISSSSPFI